MTSHSVQYGTISIEYELSYARRKTLGITVHPDKRVTVVAPEGSAILDVEAKLLKRGAWIIKQQQEFDSYLPTLPPRRYVSGETHLYLGRRYRLKVIEDRDEGVKLTHGRFFLQVRDKVDLERKKKLLDTWYRQRTKIIFPERLEAVCPRAARHGIPYPEMKIWKMKKRWGSCSTKGTIHLNLRLIQTPKACIDYVIIHVLAHLKVHSHSGAFYGLVDQLIPGWRERREELKSLKVA